MVKALLWVVIAGWLGLIGLGLWALVDVIAGPWLADVLRGLRSPEGLAQVDRGEAMRGSLRPYKQIGVRWLVLISMGGFVA